MGDLRIAKNGKDNWEVQVPVVELLTLGAGGAKVGSVLSKNSPSKILDDQLNASSKKKDGKVLSKIPGGAKTAVGVLGGIAGAVGSITLGIWNKEKKIREEEFLEVEDDMI